MKRPIEITFLGWLYILEAVFYFITIIGAISDLNSLRNSTMFSQFGFISVGIEAVLDVLGLIGGIGTLRLLQWGRKLVITSALGNIIALLISPIVGVILKYGVHTLADFRLGSYVSVFLEIRFTFLFYILTIVLLSSRRIKEQFR